jgi:short-subunit dehydrogenase
VSVISRALLPGAAAMRRLSNRTDHAGGDGRDPEVVVVTGATGGVGRATAHAFARRGARIGLVARGESALRDVEREVTELGGQALVVPTDVAHADEVEAAAEAVEARFGPIDVWVNDAMATVFARFVDTSAGEFKRATEVTYLGTVYGTMSALKRMTARDRGTIVQVGSALSYRSIPLQAAYCGAKFGIRGFTDSIRTELLHDKSRVHLTMVQLPGVNTTQFNWCRSKLPNHPQPVPPVYQPEIAAEAVYWAAHHHRRELRVGYSATEAIVGTKLAPGLADRYLARTAFSGQQVKDMPVAPGRPDNLFSPLPELAATHGMFGDRAKRRSPQLWASTHRVALASALAAGAAAAVAGVAAARLR